ncbi:Uncharacterized protein, DUF1810 family [Mesorhizobium albiziae]|uniref:Uncharacterized protein, DUF1810 family n=1 Tax=Neomesorhizobium albiziae TaxID=335020 RepID=A0A1I3V9V9_9HYPH|nr:DUF1810 domain-containing protein [Mesorhizobium albiziae]GLS28688.1 hypothetical protein GCM10007937_03950 [Mesorhizobium albiziae]SFJ90911.1 Uncharacterized protein, DUF1810 family [Mesorhizobium albiziae]
MADDPYDLNRFVAAQASVIETVLGELRRGQKASHWMWFVFPQIAGLGSSAMAQKYAIGSIGEARAYLIHPVLGERLRTCVEHVLEVRERSAHQIFGSPDDMKFQSCLTLFAEASGEEVFLRALDKYYDGEPDPGTVRILAGPKA